VLGRSSTKRRSFGICPSLCEKDMEILIYIITMFTLRLTSLLARNKDSVFFLIVCEISGKKNPMLLLERRFINPEAHNTISKQ
jgi:hypothetical protein